MNIFGVDLEIVWEIIHDDLPGLLNAVEEIMQANEKRES